MKKLFLFTLLLALPLLASAYDCQVDGIYYNLIPKGNAAEVTRGDNKYTGDVVIPENFTYESVEYSVTSIGERAFRDCYGLTSVTIPNSVTSIGNSAFAWYSGFTSVHITDLAAWCKIAFNGSNSNPLSYVHHLYIKGEEIKDLVIPNSVTSIGDYAFYGCSGLTSVTIPNSVTSIGISAFRDCSGLTSVTIGNSVTSIGSFAFNNCSGLTSVTIPNSVKSIGDDAFSQCSGLTSVTIPNSVASIGEGAFSDCSGLTSVTIPNSVTSIGTWAFYGCTGLTSVHITDLAAWCKIAFIGSYSNPLSFAHHLYLNGEEIKDLVIPNSVTYIGSQTFRECTGLTSVTIPNSVTSIENGAFEHCYGLSSIKVESGNTTYDSRNDCNAIIETASNTLITGCKNTIIPNSVTSIGDGVFASCTDLTSVTIPNSVTSIGAMAFLACSGLTSVTIPNSVTYIGNSAFSGCSGLTSVTIGSSVSSIGQLAFAECSKLEEVYCFAENVPSTRTDAFEKSYPEYMTLYVPASSLNAYKTTEPWSQFGTIKAISGSGEEPQEPEEPTKCATPTISYADKRLTFSCETEGVEYVSEIKDVDIKKFYDSSINLSATYEISVYATKSGYENSDVATATLVWTDAIFTVTTPETPTSAKAIAESIPMLISAQNGTITVRGEQNGLPLTVYTVDGKMIGSATTKDGQASIATNLQRGEIAIVKVGSKSVKIKM